MTMAPIQAYGVNPSITGEAAEKQTEFLRGRPGSSIPLTIDWVRQQMSTGNGSRGRFGAFYAKCRRADNYVLSNFTFSVPDGRNMIRLGTAHSILNTLVAHVSPQHLDVSVPAPSSRATARAEKMQNFLLGAHHMMEQNTQYGRREIAKHAGLYGVAWRKIEYDPQQWEGFPNVPEEDEPAEEFLERLHETIDRRGEQWPILGTAVNPQTVVWDTASREPRWIIHFYRLDATHVKARFPSWDGPAQGEVDFWEVWTDTHVGYVANNRWALEPMRHGYEALPWTMYRPQTGLLTIGRKPEDLYRGILDSLFEMLEAQSRLASQLVDITGTVAWPSNDWTGPPGSTERALADYDQLPGSDTYLPPGVERATSDVPQTPRALGETINFLDSAIEADSAPKVSRGQRPTGSASGYSTAVLAGIAALNFGAVVEAMERGLQHDNELMLRIVENVMRCKITVWGRTEAGNLEANISPRDIKGHYVSIVRLNTTSPEEQERKVNLWANMWKSGFVDILTALRNAGITRPLEVINARLSEDFFADPTVRQAFTMQAAERLPLLQQALDAEANGPGSAGENEQLANAVLGAATGGQFGPGNQAGNRPQNPGTGIPETTRPVMPGGLGEAELRGRQIAGPRTGAQRVPGRTLPPGMG